MLRLAPLLLLLLLLRPGLGQQCPLCFGGAEANLTKTIGGAPDGLSCGSLVSDVEIDLDGCRDLQILGYRWCDCPEYPKDYFCPMCDNAYVDIPNRFKEIPGTGKTCDEKLFVKTSAVDSCVDAMKPGFVCGCPNAQVPHCTICGMSVEEDAKITQPDALLTINGVGSYTCQELVNQAVLGALTVDQCDLVKAEAFDICGCVGSNPASDVGEDINVTTPAESETTEVPVKTDATDAPSEESGASCSKRYLLVGVLAAALHWLAI